MMKPGSPIPGVVKPDWVKREHFMMDNDLSRLWQTALKNKVNGTGLVVPLGEDPSQYINLSQIKQEDLQAALSKFEEFVPSTMNG